MHWMTCSTYARWDFTTARLPVERRHGSEDSRNVESPPVHAGPGVARGQRPGSPETMVWYHRSRRQGGPRRFRACLPREPPSRKAGHCPRRGWRPPARFRRDVPLCADRHPFTDYCTVRPAAWIKRRDIGSPGSPSWIRFELWCHKLIPARTYELLAPERISTWGKRSILGGCPPWTRLEHPVGRADSRRVMLAYLIRRESVSQIMSAPCATGISHAASSSVCGPTRPPPSLG